MKERFVINNVCQEERRTINDAAQCNIDYSAVQDGDVGGTRAWSFSLAF